jgi:quercetin dioxygenase-like cupin family protein
MKLLAAILLLAAIPWANQAYADNHKASGADIKITPVLGQDLADLPGKEGLMLTVEFPPGHVSDVHRHDAHVFVYVLEGEIEMQVAGGELKRLKRGDAFYENPQDVHSVARNASKKKRAKFLVTLVKNKGVAPVLPVQP